MSVRHEMSLPSTWAWAKLEHWLFMIFHDHSIFGAYLLLSHANVSSWYSSCPHGPHDAFDPVASCEPRFRQWRSLVAAARSATSDDSWKSHKQHVGTWFKAIRDRKMVSGNSGKNVIYTILEILVLSFGVTTVEKLEKLRYSNDDLLELVLDFQTKWQQSWVCGCHHSCNLHFQGNRSMAWFVEGMMPSYVGRTQIDIAMWSPPTGPHRSWWSRPSY